MAFIITTEAMKHNALLIAAIMLVLMGCNNEERAIQRNAYKYSYAMANYDVDAAEPYATPETGATTLKKARYLVNAVGDEYISSDTPASIEIVSVEQTSDTTAYAVYHKRTPIKNFSDTLPMRKRDGQWLAHIPMRTAPQPTAND